MNRIINIILLGILATLVSPHQLWAKDYKVEVLLFKNLTPSNATESNHYQVPQKMRSGSTIWLLEPSLLLDEANAIKNSSNYEFLHHFSWGQKSLPYAKSANFNVVESDAQGWIKIYAEQLLFANLDLDFNGYRLSEKRRLKLNEKHFFDHPKFGILLQVSRLQKKAPITTDESAAEENLSTP